MTRLRTLLLLLLGFIGWVFYVIYVGETYIQDQILTGAKDGYQNVIERLTDKSIDDNSLDQALQWIASGSAQLLVD
jgi:hypothetical protein